MAMMSNYNVDGLYVLKSTMQTSRIPICWICLKRPVPQRLMYLHLYVWVIELQNSPIYCLITCLSTKTDDILVLSLYQCHEKVMLESSFIAGFCGLPWLFMWAIKLQKEILPPTTCLYGFCAFWFLDSKLVSPFNKDHRIVWNGILSSSIEMA